MLSCLVILVSLLISSSFLTYYTYTTNKKIELINSITLKTSNETKAIIEAYKLKLAAELKAKQAKEAEEAKQAAEISKTGVASNVNAKACNKLTSRIDPSKIDVVVNKKHCIQPLEFAPTNLVSVYGANLSQLAAEPFRQMYESAAAAGLPFSVTSSYRSYQNQVSTYNFWVAKSGQVEADTYSARPGYSEHQTGLALQQTWLPVAVP